MLEFLIRNLEQRSTVCEAEKQILRELPWRTFSFRNSQELAAFSDRPEHSHLLLSGFVARIRHVVTGGRQILALHVPGDFVDLQSFLLKEMDHAVVSMTEGQLAAIAHADLTELDNRHPRLGRLLWRNSLVDAAIHREWMLGLGRQNAAQRTAHLFCEICLRLEKVRLAKNGRFELPLSQVDLSDVLGLSTVHVNRVLQDLRARQLLSLKGKDVAILDWRALADLAEFDEKYLHYDRTDIL